MKFLVLLFLVGFAAASVHDTLDDAGVEFYNDFMLGMEESPSLMAGDDIKNEIGKRLEKTLQMILESINDRIDQGKEVSADLMKKFDDIKAKLKQYNIELGEKIKEIMKKVEDKIKDIMGKITEDNKKRSVEQFLDFKEIFKKLRDSLLQKMDKEKLKAKVEEFFGKGSEMADSLLNIINEKGDKYKQKLLDLVDRYLGKKEERSISEVWEKVRDYFKNLNIELKEKYMKFGEWVKEKVKTGVDKGKSKMENIRNIAKEFIDHAKEVSKDVAVEAREFLRPYKEDLGSLWDQVKDTVKDIVNKNN